MDPKKRDLPSGESVISDLWETTLSDSMVEKSGDLKNWSAQEFSNIYVRFRPELIQHARRFLNNGTQAEEVVQDAFLYLMTSLPELDSELGVLKFLKWKIRLLSLDVIRANSKTSSIDLTEMELPSNDSSFEEDYERLEDAAVIKLALAKLSPKHREAIVASVYEEKSFREIAAQFDMNENAARQLFFRARAAFRKALVGELDTAGMSLGQVLSVATRKAYQDGKKAAAVGALALGIGGLLLSLQLFPSFNPSSVSVDAQGEVQNNSVTDVVPPSSDQGSAEIDDPAPLAPLEDSLSMSENIQTEETTETEEVTGDLAEIETADLSAELEQIETAQPALDIDSEEFEPVKLASGPMSAQSMSVEPNAQNGYRVISVCSIDGVCVSASFNNAGELDVERTHMSVQTDGGDTYISARAKMIEASVSNRGRGYELVFEDFYDHSDGRLLSQNELAKQRISLDISNPEKYDSNPNPQIRILLS